MDFHFHDLRHTLALGLAPQTDAFTLAALPGHKILAMTARYRHPTDEGKRRAIGRFRARWVKKTSQFSFRHKQLKPVGSLILIVEVR
jgi:integrase